MTVHHLHASKAALFRALLNSHTSLSGPFQDPDSAMPVNCRSLYSDQWQNRWTNRSPHKKRPLSSSRVSQCSHQVDSTSRRDKRSWSARRKTLCPAAWPRLLVDRALHYTGSRGLFPVAFGPATALVSAATTHRGPPASGRTSSGTPPLHSRSVLLLAAHSSPLSCTRHASSHHGRLHHHLLLIRQQAQPAVQPYYTH